MPRRQQPVSFRFQEKTVDRLRERARRTGAAQRELAERYIDEGLRQEDHPLIHFRTGMAGRRAALLGTRLDVADIITTVRQNDNSIDEAADYLDVPVTHVRAAARYYAEFQEEIDEEIALAAAAAEREAMLFDRQQQALG